MATRLVADVCSQTAGSPSRYRLFVFHPTYSSVGKVIHMQEPAPSAQPASSATAPGAHPSPTCADSAAVPLPPSQDIIPTTSLGHLWVFISITIGFYIAYTSWTGSAPNDDWAKRWIIVAIPVTTTIGLLLGWPSAWRTILTTMTSIYLCAPFVAARVESCALPIPDAIPCFADNTLVLEMANRLAHPVYYQVLIAIHLFGSCVAWSFVASHGGQNYVAASSTRPPTD